MVSKSRLDRIERGIDEAQEGLRREIFAPVGATPEELRAFRAEHPNEKITMCPISIYTIDEIPNERVDELEKLKREGTVDEIFRVVFRDTDHLPEGLDNDL